MLTLDWADTELTDGLSAWNRSGLPAYAGKWQVLYRFVYCNTYYRQLAFEDLLRMLSTRPSCSPAGKAIILCAIVASCAAQP